ncbi:MAG: hypothetical protein LBB83_01510 [Treponema sp.]|jgi:hypothetical protein|nr:hypothetical protein [Treponema sp.]
MNMDRNLVNRALLDVGQSPLTDADRAAENTTFLLAKQFYLETFLEALSEVPWTGGRKRARLARTGRPHLGSGYRFTYDVPFDCARPVELRDNAFFVIEDRFLCTDRDNAELLYITNGKLLRKIAGVHLGIGDIPAMEYLTGGKPGDNPEVTLYSGRPGNAPESAEPDAHPEDPPLPDEYPDYRPPEYEPKFYEYIEKMLAAKFAMKLAERPELHVQLLQEALLIREGTISASMGSSAAKRQPQRWWKEELGL